MRILPTSIQNTAVQAGIRDFILKEGVYLTAGRGSYNTAPIDRSTTATVNTTYLSSVYTVPLGRVLWLQGISISADRPVRISGRINHGQHQGPTNLNGTTELFGGTTGKLGQQWSFACDKLLFEGATISYTISSVEVGQEKPLIEFFTVGMEATNDLNYTAFNTILVAGDSITHWGLGNDPDGYPYCGKDLYASRLANRLTKLGYSTRVVNKGVRGSTSREGRYGLIDGFYDGINYDLLIVGFGTNEAQTGQATPVTAAEYKSHLQYWITWRDKYNPGKPILFMGPGSSDKTGYFEAMPTFRTAIAEFYDLVKSDATLYFLDASTVFGLTADPTLDTNFQTSERSAGNRLHWSGSGHGLIEAAIWTISGLQTRLTNSFKK